MARSNNNLGSVFRDTANAIREKTGKTNSINPKDFADEIASIPMPDGEFIISTNGNYNISQYARVDVQVASEDNAPQLYKPISLTVNDVEGSMVAEDNPENGSFPRKLRFYLDDIILYENTGSSVSYSTYFDTLNSVGNHNIYVSHIAPLFKESEKVAHPFYTIDRGGYFTYNWVKGSKILAAKFVNTYTKTGTEETGEQIKIDNDD